jgi:hypothetical protein
VDELIDRLTDYYDSKSSVSSGTDDKTSNMSESDDLIEQINERQSLAVENEVKQHNKEIEQNLQDTS